jgi:hypothetical protein
MSIRHAIWKVGASPTPLPETSLIKEELLEDMIVADPRIVSDEWMLIGRQEYTGLGGIVDLLALAPDASLVLLELKRHKTPRDVVAQSLDYASWVEKLKPQDIAAIYSRFAPGHSLAADFQKRFGSKLEEDSLNQNHQIIVVASALDSSTERIVAYLSERDIAINVLCFQIFSHGSEQLLSRAWLIDPTETQVNAATGSDHQNEPWNGEFYASFGHGEGRSWEDAKEFGFISAGGGRWYTRTLELLKPGDRVWVNVPGTGYVGVCRVAGTAQPASNYKVKTDKGELPVLEVAKRADYFAKEINNPDRCEYFVPVQWLQTVAIDKAVQEIGFFGNQNTICKPTTPKWRNTVERLKQAFPTWDK